MKWLALAIATVIVWYAGSCLFWPYARCRWCQGSGKKGPGTRKVFRPCWWCAGSGRRLRIGRRLYNWWHRRAA